MDSSDDLSAVQLWALRRLIAGVCHEVNNPLTVVQGLVELILQEESDPKKREDLEVVAQEGARAISVVRSLRAFARAPESEATPCAINAALSQVLDARGYETRARGLVLETSFYPSAPAVLCRYEDLLLMGLLLLLEAERLALDNPTSPATSNPQTNDASIMVRTTDESEGCVKFEVRNPVAIRSDSLSPIFQACTSLARRMGGRLQMETNQTSKVVTYLLSLPPAT